MHSNDSKSIQKEMWFGSILKSNVFSIVEALGSQTLVVVFGCMTLGPFGPLVSYSCTMRVLILLQPNVSRNG